MSGQECQSKIFQGALGIGWGGDCSSQELGCLRDSGGRGAQVWFNRAPGGWVAEGWRWGPHLARAAGLRVPSLSAGLSSVTPKGALAPKFSPDPGIPTSPSRLLHWVLDLQGQLGYPRESPLSAQIEKEAWQLRMTG